LPVPVHTPRDPTSLSGRRFGRLIGLLIGLALLVPVAAGPAAAPSLARGSCTGWQSRERPPNTIRVGLSDGSVRVVDFQHYVEIVTASEWPSYLPTAAIEAGATAVKQYAWAKTFAGNHRPSYYNSAGKCYDVTADTRDQIFRPNRVVTQKIKQAVRDTWGLHLRLGGDFFLTGYRTGQSRRCGADTDGYRLYARSVTDCARRGLSRQEIQFKYYGRSLTLHWADGRVISFRGSSSAATLPKPSPQPEPKPAPRATPEPTPALAFTLDLPQLTGDSDGDPRSVMVWLPSASDPAGGASQVSMPTVYSIPGTLLQLPLTQDTTDGDPWLAVCATSVGTLPVGEASYLALLPPPFGCADGSVSGAAGDLSPDGTEPVLARVYVDVERAWVIY
jgi:hypothetical protein